MGRSHWNFEAEDSSSAEALNRRRRRTYPKKCCFEPERHSRHNSHYHQLHKSPKIREIEERGRRRRSRYSNERLVEYNYRPRHSRSFCQVNYNHSNKTALRGILKHHSQSRRHPRFEEEVERRRPVENLRKYDSPSSDEDWEPKKRERPKRHKYLLGHVARATGPASGWGGGVALIIRKRNRNESPVRPLSWLSYLKSWRRAFQVTDDDEGLNH